MSVPTYSCCIGVIAAASLSHRPCQRQLAASYKGNYAYASERAPLSEGQASISCGFVQDLGPGVDKSRGALIRPFMRTLMIRPGERRSVSLSPISKRTLPSFASGRADIVAEGRSQGKAERK
jgi:hypothetical protein